MIGQVMWEIRQFWVFDWVGWGIFFEIFDWVGLVVIDQLMKKWFVVCVNDLQDRFVCKCFLFFLVNSVYGCLFFSCLFCSW